MTGFEAGDRVSYHGDSVPGAVWTVTGVFTSSSEPLAQITRKAGTKKHPGTFPVCRTVPFTQISPINKESKEKHV